MNLEQEINELETDWKDIIFEWIRNNPSKWENINIKLKKVSDEVLEILGRELTSFDPGLGALLPTGCTESPGIRIICWS